MYLCIAICLFYLVYINFIDRTYINVDKKKHQICVIHKEKKSPTFPLTFLFTYSIQYNIIQ